MFYFTFTLLLMVVIFKNKIPKNIRNLLVIAPLILIILFRYGIGADYFAYQHVYEKILVGSFSDLIRYYPDIEIGYKLIMWPFRLLNIPFHVFFVIINTVTLSLIVKWIKDNSIEFEQSILLFYSMFYFVWVLSAARQGIIMAFGLYFLFNRKVTISWKSKIALILGLALIHKSALFLLIYLLLDKFNWNRKRQAIFMVAMIIVTLLPLSAILQPLQNISITKKIITKYLSASVKFYDFPGLIRLIFFGTLLWFYDYFKDEDKKVVDRVLYGFSLYFLFKFSEITASRLSIFSFVMIVVLIPIVAKRLSLEYHSKIIFKSGVIIFSLLFFVKELNTLQVQAAFNNPQKFVRMPTIFNSSFDDFYKRESFVLSTEHATKDLINEYKNVDKKKTSYDENLDYLVVQKGVRDYRIIDTEGNYLEDYQFNKEVYLTDGIIIDQRFYKHHFFSNPMVKDLSTQDRSRKEMEAAVVKSLKRDNLLYRLEEYQEASINDIPSSLLKHYTNKDEIKNIWMSKVSRPFEYYVLRVDYLDQKSYIYLDENKEPMIDLILTYPNPFERTGTVKLAVQNMNFIMNKEGKIIWVD